jgi:pyrroline-5-carboxylate reductase
LRIAFIGGGNMARAIIGALVARGTSADEILVVEIDAAARSHLTKELGVEAIERPGPQLAHADVVIFAVKPQQMREAAAAVAPHLRGCLVVTIAAGIRLMDLARWLGGYERLVRAMPNTPALVHAGMTGLFASDYVGIEDRNLATKLMSAVGAVAWFDAEADLDTVTAVSGSGPAYVFYVIEALEAAAKSLGIEEATARSLALWTFAGATKLAVERGEAPAALRAQVTSRGGTTERALESLEQARVKERFIDAVRAAAERSRELGEMYGKD